MRIQGVRVILAVAVFSVLAGCNAIDTNSREIAPPVGIGTGINDLKRTPCACTEIPMNIPSEMMG